MNEEHPYKQADLTGTDFRAIDLSGQNLSHSNLTGCRFGRCVGANFVCTTGTEIDFVGADISRTFFEQAHESVLARLVGATWNGATVTHVSGWLTQDFYWCFVTNAFVQIGCMQKPLDEWRAIGESRESLGDALRDRLSTEQLDATFNWWQKNSALLIECSNNFAAME